MSGTGGTMDPENARVVDDAMDDTMIWIGRRLRSVREQRQLSLTDVERQSGGEFGPSTIGAYERGDRTISLPRLDRLADFYRVPIAQLLPRAGVLDTIAPPTQPSDARIIVDIDKLKQLHGPAFLTLARFVDLVRTQRHDWDSNLTTLRQSDAMVIAAILSVPADAVIERLAALDLLGRAEGQEPGIRMGASG